MRTKVAHEASNNILLRLAGNRFSRNREITDYKVKFPQLDLRALNRYKHKCGSTNLNGVFFTWAWPHVVNSVGDYARLSYHTISTAIHLRPCAKTSAKVTLLIWQSNKLWGSLPDYTGGSFEFLAAIPPSL